MVINSKAINILAVLAIMFVMFEAFQTIALVDHRAELVDHEARLQVMEEPPEKAWRDIAIDVTIPYTPPVWPRPVISLKADTMTRCYICRRPAEHDSSITLVVEHTPGTSAYVEIKRHQGIKKIEPRPGQKSFAVCKDCANTFVGFTYIQIVSDKEDKNNG